LALRDSTEDCRKRTGLPDGNAAAKWEASVAEKSVTEKSVEKADSEALARLARLFKIVTLVSAPPAGRPLGRRELSAACECEVRTVQRDLALLAEAGSGQSAKEVEQAQAWRREEAERRPYLDRAQQELVAIHAGSGVIPKPRLIEVRAQNMYLIAQREPGQKEG